MSTVRQVVVPKEWSAEFARELEEHLRDVTNIVNGGVRLRDQLPSVKTNVRWNSSNAPVVVGPFQKTIRWVMVLAARQTDSPGNSAGGIPVKWTMVGSNVHLLELDSTTPGVDYDLDLWFLEG